MCCCPSPAGFPVVVGGVLALWVVYEVVISVLTAVATLVGMIFMVLPYLLLGLALIAFVSYVIAPQGPEATPEATPKADTDAVVEEAVEKAMRNFEARRLA